METLESGVWTVVFFSLMYSLEQNISFGPKYSNDIAGKLKTISKAEKQGWALHSFPFRMFRSFPF